MLRKYLLVYYNIITKKIQVYKYKIQVYKYKNWATKEKNYGKTFIAKF